MPKGTIPTRINQNELIKLSYELTNNQLAKHFQCDLRSITHWKSVLRKRGRPCGSGPFPQSQSKIYNDYIKLNIDRFIVIGDCEIPDHDAEMFSIAYDVAQKYQIHNLIINGDFLALDSFSQWAKSVTYKLAFKEELEPAMESIKVFLRHFKSLYWITGNHERRLAHKMDGEITIAEFFKKFSGLQTSEYAYCEVNCGNKEILVCHQDNYSKRPLAVPYELAAVKLKNIIAGHTHHLAQGYDRSGKFWVIDGGHCRSKERTSYKSLRINTHPEWNPGFVMVIDGVPHLINKENYYFYVEKN